jgi:hypothetical protein
VGRRPPPSEAEMGVVQSGGTPGQMWLETSDYHSLQQFANLIQKAHRPTWKKKRKAIYEVIGNYRLAREVY